MSGESRRVLLLITALLVALVTGVRVVQMRALPQGVPSPLSPVALPLVVTQSVLPGEARLRILDLAQGAGPVPLYQKFEATFAITGTIATNLDFPYDPAPPPGLPGRIGLSVEALLLPPGADRWDAALRQPAFQYQAYARVVSGEREGLTPQGAPGWRLRFAPTQPGVWTYKLRAQDASICPPGLRPCPHWVETAPQQFTAVAPAPGSHGFVRVSPTDPRYFEFSDGTPFLGLGHQTSFDASTRVEERFDTYRANGVTLLRAWMSASGVYGLGFEQWGAWANATLVFAPVAPGSDVAARIAGADESPCIFQGFGEGAQAALDGGRRYRVEVSARLEGVGPRDSGAPHGLVVTFGGWPKDRCGQPGNGLVALSDYWGGTRDWQTYTSTFTLPDDVVIGQDGFLTVALENSDGVAYIDQVRVIDLASGASVLPRSSLNDHLSFDQAASWRWDTILDRAAERGVFLKLVVLEKQDAIFGRINPDGTTAATPSDRNFYGYNPEQPGQPTKVRRLHEYYWRYLSARWGYSTAVHSWELLNEGDPFNGEHYDQANAMGRTIRETDPNTHLVTTSFWHSFPSAEFWANPDYPYVDYADVHAYVDTSWLEAPGDIQDAAVRAQCGASRACYRAAMTDDSALYHSEHSLAARRIGPAKPIVRGEAGLTLDETAQVHDPQIAQDLHGVWLHKLLFAQVGSGALTEIYWFTDEIVANGLYPIFRRYRDVMAGIPFSAGGFTDASPAVQGAALRVFGQKDVRNGRAYLWVDNRSHTWKRVVNGAPIPPASGRITIEGFAPGAALPIAYWRTCSGQAPGACAAGVESTATVTADRTGAVTIVVTDLPTDIVVRIGDFDQPAGQGE